MNQIQHDKSYSSHVQEELLNLEKGFWEKGNDPNYFREHMADSGLAILEPGIISKGEAIDMTSISKPWSDVEFSEVRLYPLCVDCTALIYTADGHRPDNGEAYRSRVCSTYVRRDGRWQIALHQQTMVPTKALPK
jgi:hypothetical protein